MSKAPSGRAKRSWPLRLLRGCLLLLLVVILAVLSSSAGLYVALAQNLPTLESKGEYKAAQSTKIYDAGEKPVLLATLHGTENREIVGADQIPQDMRDAVVAIEDERFYSHRGIDFLAILRALYEDLRHRSVVEGGSTITQQYIKNAYMTNEKTLNRKITEAALAYQLEKKWSKDKILNAYLNVIYFGHGAYGVEAASQSYFGIHARELSLAQAALLAAVPKSPSHYSPRANAAAARERRDLILNKMFQQGYITSEELQKALSTPIKVVERKDDEASREPYWVEFVREQLVAKYGGQTVLQGGLRVYTSLDLRRQELAEKAIKDILNQPGDPAASLVSINLRTGRVVAMVGGADFSKQQFNLATQAQRQPGSAFKTFVLVSALQQGMTLASTYDSGPVTVSLPGSDWKVDSRDVGDITLAEATSKSVNGVFARLIMDVGAEKVVETARLMGVESELNADPAIALGGLEKGVCPLEMAVAYGTLGAGGNRLSGSVVFDQDHKQYPISIIRVEDATGKVLDDNKLVKNRVLDEALAYTATAALKTVIASGTGTAADIGRPAAGKTGTTQEYRDAWFVGYTPDFVTAVWVGYPDEQKEMTNVHGINVTGGSFPARIWAAYMKAAHEGIEPSDFPKPEGAEMVVKTICSESGKLATDWCPDTEKATFVEGTAPAGYCTLHEPREVTVPDVVGMTKAEATEVLEQAKFKVEIEEEATRRAPAGTVVSQDPKAGTTLLQGKTVTLTVASELSGAGVPRVVGMNVSDAREELRAAGYDVAEVARADDKPEGTVVEQYPSAGAPLEPGGTVTVTVSTGPASGGGGDEQVEVPEVVGLSVTKATRDLARAGFRTHVQKYTPTESAAKVGLVAKQSPGAGGRAPVGATVELTVYSKAKS